MQQFSAKTTDTMFPSPQSISILFPKDKSINSMSAMSHICDNTCSLAIYSSKTAGHN